MQLGVGVGVLGDLKERLEDVVQQLLEVLYDALLLVQIIQPWQLHHATHITSATSKCKCSKCQVVYCTVPFINLSSMSLCWV